MIWSVWWAWLVAALVLAILEIFAPAFLFLGFAVGAAVTGVLMAFGGPLAVAMTGSLPVTLLVFAVASLAAWIALRRVLGIRDGQVKVFDRDINED
ncbi:MAG: hypothetical protein AAGK37_22425 [Pseudomonadota bacterium]